MVKTNQAVLIGAYESPLLPGDANKVVEGLALGKPMLSTTLGAEGVAARNNENMLLRDTPADWLQALRDYYHHRLPLAELSEQAARTAHEQYDTTQVTRQLLALYRQVAPALPPAAP